MKKITTTLLAFAFTATLFAQKMSVQLNTGYNYLLGTKIDKLGQGDKPSLGSFTDGTIPVGIEARYYQGDNLFFNLGYSYHFDLGHSFTIPGSSTMQQSSKLNPQTIQLGGAYYLTQDALKVYAGLDANLYIANTTITTTNSTITQYVPFSKREESFSYITAGVGPKIGFDYALNENLFMNVNAYYNFIISQAEKRKISKTTTITTPAGTTKSTEDEEVSFNNSNLLGITVGIGYKF